MHFYVQWYNFYQEPVSSVDPSGKPRERRWAPPAPSPPTSPLNVSSQELEEALHPHLLTPERMWALGYPEEIEPNSTKAVMYVNPPPRTRTPPFTAWDVNAPEFVPGSQGDSGNGSLGSSPRSDSDEEADVTEHLCVRCDKMFRISRDGEYVESEPCVYHWGRVSKMSGYACCDGAYGAKGINMHFCVQCYNFYQESVSSADPSGKPRERRRAPPAPSPPTSPQNVSSQELEEALRPHLLTPERMWALGYPVEIEPNSTKAVMYVNPPPRTRTPPFTAWDVNAPEFVPGSQGDSGNGSLGSSPRSDSDEEADVTEHLCVRCDKMFRISRDGEYVESEPCVYHWGRVSKMSGYACCNGAYGAKGCSTARSHVWNGTRPGMNGPMEGYVRAKSPRGGVYALDVEMCYTTAGLELASVAVVASDGRLVYHTYVKPSSPIIDYNTRFSGIKPRDLARVTKTLKEVQNDILGFIGNDTILIGHALNNDLRALKLLHYAVVDTCDLYPHARGFPYRRSLKALSEELLGRKVQNSSSGHSPFEDARAAMDLVLLKVNEDQVISARLSCTLSFLQPYDPLVGAT